MLGISIVICSFTEDRWNDLTEAVDSVRTQSLPPREIFVVVDHHPGLLDRCRSELSGVTALESRHQPGLSGARNTGVEASEGSVVAFLDDDAVAAPDWLESLARGYDSSAVIAVGGHVEAHWLAGRPAWFPPEFDWVVGCSYAGMPQTATPVRNLIGANMSFRRQSIADLGGFRSVLGRVASRPTGCEETDLCIRAGQRWPDRTILYDPAARVRHSVPPDRGSLGYYVARCVAEGRSKATLSGLVGTHDGLASERDYVRRTLPAAATRRARGTGPARLRQPAAMALGLGATGVGYALGRVEAVRPRVVGAPEAGAGSRGGRHLGSPTEALKLLMVTPRYPPDVGGVERHVSEVSTRLAGRGCRVTVLCTDRTGRLPAGETHDGVEVRRVRAWPRARDYYVAPGIYREVSRGGWDLVHVQSYHTLVAPLAILGALRANVPYVVTFHGGGHSSGLRKRLRPLQRRLLRPLLTRAARLVAIARFEIELYGRELSIPAERFTLIPNGAELTRGAGGGSSDRPADGALIASVGRLERYKGHDRVLAALPHVLKERPQARLWLAGSGPYERTLRRMADRLGVASKVEIASAASGGELAARLTEVSVVVLLSEFETHPLAALEALSLRRPLLVAAAPGLQELADEGLARAVERDSDPRALARAIIEQLDRPLVPAAVELPSWDDCAGELARLYEDVSARPLHGS